MFARGYGEPWRETDYRYWRRRAFRDAAKALKEPELRPYDLRHSFVSLLIAEGASIGEIAKQAVHAPTMTLGVYGHAVKEFTGRPVDAEDAIEEARNRARMFPYGSRRAAVGSGR